MTVNGAAQELQAYLSTHDLGQDTIAADIGYSQVQVSRLLRRALASLRAQLLDF